MAIPKNKAELLAAIEDSFIKLENDLIDIPIELTNIIELEGHKKDTQMSVCNLVAYLIGWGELVIKWHKLFVKNKAIDFPETGFKWTELGDLAQKFYADYSMDDFPTLLKKLRRVVKKINKIIEQSSNEDLYKIPMYKTYPLGRMIQLNTSSPYKNARSRIRKWKKLRTLTD